MPFASKKTKKSSRKAQPPQNKTSSNAIRKQLPLQNNHHYHRDNDSDSSDDKSDSSTKLMVTPRRRDERSSRPHLKKAINRQMIRSGFAVTEDALKVDVTVFVRNKLFKLLKFAQPGHLVVSGAVAKMVREELGISDKKSFRLDWQNWMSKHVRNVINDKRSSCGQSIAKVLMGT